MKVWWGEAYVTESYVHIYFLECNGVGRFVGREYLYKAAGVVE